MTNYKSLQVYYENCLAEHGPNNNGVDWGDLQDLITRYHVMAGLFKNAEQGEIRLLDVGCGPGLFLDFLNHYMPEKNIIYIGVDISPEMVSAARQRHPGITFHCLDLLQEPLPDDYDFAVVNGVFTIKESIQQSEMCAFYQELLRKCFEKTHSGIAANFITKYVDWEKDRLFHLPVDEFMAFAVKDLSRHIAIRHDYGLWEYTAYVYREPIAPITDKTNQDFIKRIEGTTYEG